MITVVGYFLDHVVGKLSCNLLNKLFCMLIWAGEVGPGQLVNRLRDILQRAGKVLSAKGSLPSCLNTLINNDSLQGVITDRLAYQIDVFESSNRGHYIVMLNG